MNNSQEILKTKVTKIKNKYHCRLYEKNKVINEMACIEKSDISFCMHEMLRWYNKLGGISKMASASRLRNKNYKPNNKIWYKKDL